MGERRPLVVQSLIDTWFARRVIEPDPGFRAVRATIDELRETELRGATDDEVAELEAVVRDKVADPGATDFIEGDSAPEFPQTWWDSIVAELREPPPAAATRARLGARAPARDDVEDRARALIAAWIKLGRPHKGDLTMNQIQGRTGIGRTRFRRIARELDPDSDKPQ